MHTPTALKQHPTSRDRLPRPKSHAHQSPSIKYEVLTPGDAPEHAERLDDEPSDTQLQTGLRESAKRGSQSGLNYTTGVPDELIELSHSRVLDNVKANALQSELRVANAGAGLEKNSQVSSDGQYDKRDPQIEGAKPEIISISSSPLSTPPSSRPTLSQKSTGGSRKRKRSPAIVIDIDDTSSNATTSGRSTPTSTPLPSPTIHLDENRRSASHSRSCPSSSLSFLSTTPTPLNTASTMSQAMSQTGVPTTTSPAKPISSSLSVLSTTPAPPEEVLSQRRRNLGDSQDGDELSDGGVFETGKEEAIGSRQSSGAYCASDSDSDGDLEDLQTLFGIKERRAHPEAAGTADQERCKDPHEDMPRETPRSSKKDLKYSLQRLLRDNKSEADHRKRIQEAQDKLDAAEASGQMAKEAALGESDDVDMLVALADKTEDKEHAAKLRLAMERQELLTTEVDWRFFDVQNQDDDLGVPNFPALGNDSLSDLADPLFREQAFLAGFVSDLLPLRKPPSQKMISWLWHAAIYEPREDLSGAYRSTLATLPEQVREDFNFAYISEPLEAMCATEEAMKSTQALKHTIRPTNEPPSRAPKRLFRFFQTVRCILGEIPLDLLPSLTSLFLRLAIDRSVTEDLDLHVQLRAILGSLIEASLSDCPLGDLGNTLVAFVPLPALQRRVLSVLPDTTAKQNTFKRRLALAFFFGDSTLLSCRLENSRSTTHRITSHIRTSTAFDMFNERIDYRSLTASIAILDIAIGAGFVQPRAVASDANTEVRKTAKMQEKDFNEQADALSAAVNMLYARIQDTGASHMLRTTAKSTIQNLALRIDNGIRTRPRPRRDMLQPLTASRTPIRFSGGAVSAKRKVTSGESVGGADAEEDKQASIMQRFLDRKGRAQQRLASPQAASGGAEGASTADNTVGGAEEVGFGSSADDQSPTGPPPSLGAKPKDGPRTEPRRSTYEKFLERKKRMGLKSPLSAQADENSHA